MKQIEVSVVVPVYNGKRFLRMAVVSLLNEEIPEVEVIVVDDGSQDDCLESISDLPVRLVRLESNHGVAAARNAGVAVAQGKYVTFLDSDDVLCPRGLKWRLAWIRQNPEALGVAGRPAGIIDEEGNVMPAYPHVLHPDFHPPRELSLDFFKKGGAYPMPLWNYMFQRSVLQKVGPFNENLRIAEDCEFLFRVLKYTTIPVIFEPVVYRRLHEGNISVQMENGEFALNPQTIEAVKQIYSPHGIFPKEWKLWEKGYAS